MTAPACDMPVPGGCPHPARAIVLARSSEELVGNGMAVWTTYLRCQEAHHASQVEQAIHRSDPRAIVYVIRSYDERGTFTPMEPGEYDAMMARG